MASADHFVDHLATLFRHNPDLTAGAVCRQAGRLGHPITESCLSQIRNGHIRDPGFTTITGIAMAFRVDIDFFTMPKPGETLDDKYHRARLTDASVGETVADLTALPSGISDAVLSLLEVMAETEDKDSNGPSAASSDS
ncbi:hypothetical protein [Gordonia soli]|uniref:HTH cro/C1-type domain-containing protein n=1 Tax=Gordonia soli NBRC 108243 TaxID=1223545 RepID=M0QLG5_9ACTN|nr:hypothetical protein [Gordonia soli]GAC68247.1 hypothetical protein GS4_14_00780 [Gordonia soli NBRC 108243]